MQKHCLVVRRRDSGAALTPVIEQCGYAVHEVGGEVLDDRDILGFLAEQPTAIVLPLSLPRYASLRIAELIALRRQRIRLILVSATEAPRSALLELFDCHLPACGDGLVEALGAAAWTHAFERRSVTIDAAIQALLRTASCFWVCGGRHPELVFTLVDYQRALADASRQFTILFLASDPSDGARLRLIKELSEIERELGKRSEYSFTLKHMFSSRPDELSRRLLEDRPHIVHFMGHGDARGRLCFEDASGRSWPADKAAIAQIFEPSRRYVKCVVLNACYSGDQAALIGAHVEYAIGLQPSVSDQAAIVMAKGFYGALAATGRMSSAVVAARANLALFPDGHTELCCVHSLPEFHGFVPTVVDSRTAEPAMSRKIAEANQLVSEDIALPIPPTASGWRPRRREFVADEHGAIVAGFAVRDTPGDILAFYLQWAQANGWLTEAITACGEFQLRLRKGARWIRVQCSEGNEFSLLHIRFEQTASARFIDAQGGGAAIFSVGLM